MSLRAVSDLLFYTRILYIFRTHMNQNQKQPQSGGYRPFSPTKHSLSPSAAKSTVKRSVGSRAGHLAHSHGQLQNPAQLHKIMSLFQ